MKILFIYTVQKSLIIEKPLKGQEDIQMGIAQLSSVLKEGGHQTDLLVLDRRYKKRNYRIVDKKFQSAQYELVCFTSVYSEFLFVKEIANYIKNRFTIFSILGGVHVTISPDEAYLDIFDALCIGEGENALLELADKLEKQADVSSVSNLWIKQNGHIIKNETRGFIQNLDDLPFVDRDLWQPLIVDTNTRLTILLGRGCPYKCTYCCNHRIREVAAGKYVRMRSAENIIAEMKYLTSKFPAITEYFLEIETLGTDKDWLLALCDQLFLFNEQLHNKLSFSANLRIHDKLDFDLIFSNLRKANFESGIIGLESGNERIRKEILNRQYSNETIIRVVESARKHGIKVGIFNLIGIPTESLDDFKDTLRLNQQLQPDWHATSIFFPYKGTKLYDMASELGLLPAQLNFKDERQHAVLNLPQFSSRCIQKQFDSFHYNVYKTYENRSLLKTILFWMQKILGHNFMANSKNRLTIILYRLKIRNNFLKIIQKV